MIDIEPMVFEAVRNAVSPVMCSPTYQDRSKVFPLVTVEEYDNSVYEKTQDSGNYENHAKLKVSPKFSSFRFCGWNTGMPIFSAATFTGGGSIT